MNKKKLKESTILILTDDAGGEGHDKSRGILRTSDSRKPWRRRIAFAVRSANMGNAERRSESQILL